MGDFNVTVWTEETQVQVFEHNTQPVRQGGRGTMTESSVYAVMIWLRSTDVAMQPNDPQLSVQEGHRSFIFNPPALSHVRYAHFSGREEALEALKFLGQELQEGHTLYVHEEQSSFAVPARSVLYVALAQSRAQAVNPDDGSAEGRALHAMNAHPPDPPSPEPGPAVARWSNEGGHGRSPGPAEKIVPLNTFLADFSPVTLAAPAGDPTQADGT